MKSKIKPLGQRVLVLPAEAETKTASGLIIPESAQSKQNKGEILVVSKELSDDEKNELKEGQTILYAKYRGDEIEIDGKTYIMLETSDILAILG